MFKILAIDDDPTILKVTQVGLQKENVNSICFQDAEEAVDYYKTHYSEIQAILTDYMMPKIDGQEVIKRIRDFEFESSLDKPDVPIVVLTAQGGTKVAVELLKSGATDYIEKPIISASLLSHRIEIAINSEEAKYLRRKQISK